MRSKRNFNPLEFEYKKRELMGKLISYQNELMSKTKNINELRIISPMLILVDFNNEEEAKKFAVFHLVAEQEWIALFDDADKEEMFNIGLGKLLKEERGFLNAYFPTVLVQPELIDLAIEIRSVHVKLYGDYINELLRSEPSIEKVRDAVYVYSFIKQLKEAINNKKIQLRLNYSEETIISICQILEKLNISHAIVTIPLKKENELERLLQFMQHGKFLQGLTIQSDSQGLSEKNIKLLSDAIRISTLRSINLRGCAFYKAMEKDFEGALNDNLTIISDGNFFGKAITGEIFERKIIPTSSIHIFLVRNYLLQEIQNLRRAIEQNKYDEKLSALIDQVRFKIEKLRTIFGDKYGSHHLHELDKVEFLMMRDLTVLFMHEMNADAVFDPLLSITESSHYYLFAKFEVFIIAYENIHQLTSSPLTAFIKALPYCIYGNEFIDLKGEQQTFDGFLCGAADIKKQLGTHLTSEERISLLQYVCLKYMMDNFKKVMADNPYKFFQGHKLSLPNINKIEDLDIEKDKEKNTHFWSVINNIKKELPETESDFKSILNVVEKEVDKHAAGSSLTFSSNKKD